MSGSELTFTPGHVALSRRRNHASLDIVLGEIDR